MSEKTRPLRTDARRNRERVLSAAEAVLAREGSAASMRAVAEAAGVGLGTIYRHFPTREALFAAVMSTRMLQLAELSGELSEAADAGAAFFEFFTAVVDNAGRMRAVADALADAGVDVKTDSSDVSGAAAALRTALGTLLERARQHGRLRPDLHLPEALALLAAMCLAAERHQWDPAPRDRALAILFDGFRPR
ncbi:TetR family transcriptional regulator [Kitasatospora phosalacinea]|uniref:TetR family transcriptional regulator n=1 Tax=Kitasatospora phosalacinea TaxID=2065 RepID=A0A9W6Q4B2_9ACTN|nr:TetR/AcrR family transcriptional regulator [Kitasatospora phosalacinea]GLW68278.1 TetR family transcriptional regulator [Kitasatospora phosalacinea]